MPSSEASQPVRAKDAGQDPHVLHVLAQSTMKRHWHPEINHYHNASHASLKTAKGCEYRESYKQLTQLRVSETHANTPILYKRGFYHLIEKHSSRQDQIQNLLFVNSQSNDVAGRNTLHNAQECEPHGQYIAIKQSLSATRNITASKICPCIFQNSYFTWKMRRF